MYTYSLNNVKNLVFFECFVPAASNNPETVKTLKTVFETLRTAAKTYAQVTITQLALPSEVVLIQSLF